MEPLAQSSNVRFLLSGNIGEGAGKLVKVAKERRGDWALEGRSLDRPVSFEEKSWGMVCTRY